MEITKPELLAPAGDLEKLKVAIAYGADAVYIGGQSYGLRAKAKNFGADEMSVGIDYAHSHGVKAYVTANIFAHNDDYEGMANYFKEVYNSGADALIISDPGIFSLAREVVPNIDIHISTQANTTNYRSVNFWESLGAKRVVLARELSFDEINCIKQNTPQGFELECFVHGAMCISYSGRCLLSSYMCNRDSNRGECAHPCRWDYKAFYLNESGRPDDYYPVYEDERGTYIFNSKDLCMIQHIPDLIKSGIYSFKIEGRMKTPYYVGTVVKAYREAIDDFFSDPELYERRKAHYMDSIRKCSHRQFTTGFFFNSPDSNDQIYNTSAYIRTYGFVGIVQDYDEINGIATVEQRNKFVCGEEIEFLTAKGTSFSQIITEMNDINGFPISEAPHPQQILKIKTSQHVNKFDMLRRAEIPKT